MSLCGLLFIVPSLLHGSHLGLCFIGQAIVWVISVMVIVCHTCWYYVYICSVICCLFDIVSLGFFLLAAGLIVSVAMASVMQAGGWARLSLGWSYIWYSFLFPGFYPSSSEPISEWVTIQGLPAQPLSLVFSRRSGGRLISYQRTLNPQIYCSVIRRSSWPET